MTALVTMRDALADRHLLGEVMPGESWLPWRALLIAAMGEELTETERAIFTALTGRQREPLSPVEEAWFIIGRRGGKTRAAACAATYLAALCDHSAVLSLGERGVLPFLAASTRQASIAYAYATAIMESQPMLAGLVMGKTADTLSLSTGVDLEIRPASFRTARGITAIGIVADEVAFWHSDASANPDEEILNSLRPAMATTGGPLLAISSPYRRRGALWDAYRRHYGPDGDSAILVARGASGDLNPTLPQRVVDRAMERDPAAARAEYLAEFRTDIESFVSQEAVEACISAGVRERPRVEGVRYHGFVDPSGGSVDSFTAAVSHFEDGRAILDAVRERRPPFSPEGVAEEFAGFLKSYGIASVRGDRYAGEWPREQFRKNRIEYLPADRSKSEIYVELLPAINSGGVDLLDVDRLQAQLCGLERRTARSGKDSIDHGPGGHDDLINAAAGALVAAAPKRAAQEPAIGLPVSITGRLGDRLERTDRMPANLGGGNFVARDPLFGQP